MICLLAFALVQAPSPPGLGLSEAWQSALQRRGLARSASAAIAGADAGVRLAGQVPNPGLSVSHTGSTPRGHLLVDQPFSWLLTRGPDRDVARAALQRSQVDSAVDLARLGAEVRGAFYGALSREERRRLRSDQQLVADSLVGIARRRYRAGDIAQFELEQVELESSLQSQLLGAEGDEVAVARASLAATIGWPSDSLPPLTGGLDDGLIETRDSVAAFDLPAVRAAEADSSLAALSVHSAKRARIPFPSLEVGTEWDDPAYPGQNFAVVGLAIPVPLWDWGGGQIALAKARAEGASAQLLETRLASRRIIAEARIRLRGTAARALFARDSLVPAAARLRTRALAAYQAGETGLTPVLEAIRREREVQLGEIEALIAFQDAVASLQEILGETP
jgi:cobalt-zinc-cadmium efflux system outer membrane protein